MELMVIAKSMGMSKGTPKGLVHLPDKPELELYVSWQLLIRSVCMGSS